MADEFVKDCDYCAHVERAEHPPWWCAKRRYHVRGREAINCEDFRRRIQIVQP